MATNSTILTWLADAEKYVPELIALEAGTAQNVTIPPETSPAVDLGPLGKFEVSSPSVVVTVKKVG